MTKEALQDEDTMEVMVMGAGVDMEDEAAGAEGSVGVGVGEGSEEGGNGENKTSWAIVAFVSQIGAFRWYVWKDTGQFHLDEMKRIFVLLFLRCSLIPEVSRIRSVRT